MISETLTFTVYAPALVGATDAGPYVVCPLPEYEETRVSDDGMLLDANGRGVPLYVAVRATANSIDAVALTMSPCRTGWVSV